MADLNVRMRGKIRTNFVSEGADPEPPPPPRQPDNHKARQNRSLNRIASMTKQTSLVTSQRNSDDDTTHLTSADLE